MDTKQMSITQGGAPGRGTERLMKKSKRTVKEKIMRLHKTPRERPRERATRTAAALFAFLGLAIFVPSTALANNGWFIGYGVAQVDIGGDMSGETFVEGGDSIEVLPEQEKAIGNEISLDYRVEGLSIEFGATRSEHDGQWLGIPTTSEFSSYNFDIKFHFRRATKIQPLLILGVAFTDVVVKDGSSNGVIVQDAEYSGLDARFGAGIEFVLHEHFALDLQGVYRYGSYTNVDGVSSGSLDDGMNGDGLTASAIAKVIF